MRTVTHPSATAVAVTGSATIAIAFGFARYGYGLFVPALRAEFGLTTSTVGLVGGLGYLAYLVGLLGSRHLTSRHGPRRPVLCGCIAAAGGAGLVATATGVPQLVVGVVIAASASGWAWAPFPDAVAFSVREPLRARVTSTIGTGTTFGLIIAGFLALFTGGTGGWRTSWAIFAVVATLTGLAVLRVLPARSAATSRQRTPLPAPRPRDLPLLGQAVIYGGVASIYYTYAVDLVRTAGLGPQWAALLWALVGLGGVSGLATGEVVARLGLRRTFGLALVLLAMSIAGLAAAPSDPVVAGAAAAAFGFAYMPLAVLLTLWSGAVHPQAPTAGFTRVLAAMSVGSIGGPLLLGPLADAIGLRAVFMLIATVTVVGLALRPPATPADQPLVRTTRKRASPAIIRS